MPPKREPIAFIAVPEQKAAPPNPLIVAAQVVVDKWNQRLAEARARVEECSKNIKLSERAVIDNENMIGTLLQQATDLVYPKEVKEVPIPQVVTAGQKSSSIASPKSSKTGPTPLQPIASETLVPAPPPMTEAQQKKKAKTQGALLNAYKKKKYVPSADEVALGVTVSTVNAAAADGGYLTSPRSGDVRPTRPNDVKDELWEGLMTLRDNRIDCEDKVVALKQQVEMLRQRLHSLVEMERVTRYAMIASENELLVTTQRVEEQARLAKEQAKFEMENKASRPSSSFGAHTAAVVNAPVVAPSTSIVSPRAPKK